MENGLRAGTAALLHCTLAIQGVVIKPQTAYLVSNLPTCARTPRRMDVLEAIFTRRTIPPVKMGPPGPDEVQIRHILEAGCAAPDHGMLRPWRFLVVQGEGRRKLGELFADTGGRRSTQPTPRPRHTEQTDRPT